jgi:hypothetical protein
MDGCEPQRLCPFDDQARSRREKQGRKLRWRRYGTANLSRPSERLVARKLAVADQDTNVINAEFRDDPCFIGAGDLIDLSQHGAARQATVDKIMKAACMKPGPKPNHMRPHIRNARLRSKRQNALSRISVAP